MSNSRRLKMQQSKAKLPMLVNLHYSVDTPTSSGSTTITNKFNQWTLAPSAAYAGNKITISFTYNTPVDTLNIKIAGHYPNPIFTNSYSEFIFVNEIITSRTGTYSIEWTVQNTFVVDGIYTQVNGSYEVEDIYITVQAYTSETTSVCLAADTQVLLANGSYKKIEDIQYTDLLLTYDPYVGSFVGQYPLQIRQCTPTRPRQQLIATFENGVSLNIYHGHIVYNMEKQLFERIGTEDLELNLIDINNFYGAFYNLNTKQFEPIKLISVEPIDEKNTIYYTVDTPMHGSIITNNLWTGGNLMFYNQVEKLLKGEQKNINWNKQVIETVVNISEEEIEKRYVQLYEDIKQYDQELLLHFFMGTVLQYIDYAEELGLDIYSLIDRDSIIRLDAGILKIRNQSKPYPFRLKINLDGEETNIDQGQEYIFPDKYNKYIDLSNYKTYNKGDKKKVFVSTTIIGINNE